MTTLPDPPRSSLIDPRTGQLTREWVRFFDDLRRAIVSGLDDAVGGRLDALEMDTLFAGGEGGGDGGTRYNDATVRARLDQIETEMLFPALSNRAETEARIGLIQSDIDTALDAVFAPDHTAALRAMKTRMDAVELSLVLIDDTTARLNAVLRRMVDLETENLF